MRRKRIGSLGYEVLFAALVLLPSSAAAESEEYLRGYVDALLAGQKMDAPVRLLHVEPATRQAVLIVTKCLPEVQRKNTERKLLASGLINQVQWDGLGDCVAVAGPKDTPVVTQAQAKKLDATKVVPLPEVELFDPIIADPRQPQFSVRYQHYRTPTNTFNAASTSFGDYFGFASGLFGSQGVSQIGLQGAVFALFNLDAPSLDLVNADYWLGIPVTYRKGSWSFLGRLYHQSSHLGDEFILGQPGIDRINLSYEDVELLASYDWRQWRVYGGGGYIVHSEPDLKPLHAQAGIEFVYPNFHKPFDLVAAMDVQADEELDWEQDFSFQLGFAFRRKDHQIRFMLEHYRGFSPNGQFFRDRLRYTGLGVYFDL